MKSGASDPFADDDDAESETERGTSEAAETEAGTTGSETDETGTQSPETGSEASTAGTAGDDSAGEPASGDSETADAPLELPYIYRRDKVKDERPDVHQLFVQDETDTRARDAERDLEKLLGEDVYRLDAREAIYLAGMRHLDEAADLLREWGYDR